MTEAKANIYLEEERLERLMLKYAIPCVISMLVAALYNIERCGFGTPFPAGFS